MTFYLVSVVPPDMVKKFGHWRSQAFLEYWCCLDYLGAIHFEMLPLTFNCIDSKGEAFLRLDKCPQVSLHHDY
jgi:hypothetical protein